MNYATIKWCDDTNGEGLRLSLFVSGCSKYCKGCFNKEAFDKNYGNEFSREVKEEILEYFEKNKDYTDGLSWLGGDPLENYNFEETIRFSKIFKERFPNKTIWCWTGSTYEEFTKEEQDIIGEVFDVLIDGKFVQELYEKDLKWRGSSNQRIIDLKETKEKGKIVEINY